jgi:hypothetical protein
MPSRFQFTFGRSIRRRSRTVGRLLGLLGLSLSIAFGGLRAAEAAGNKEQQVKAAFLYNFTKFVEWPEQDFGEAGRSIVIGVIGSTVIRDELEKIVRGRKVNGRDITVHLLETIPDSPSVDLLFITAEGEARLAVKLDQPALAGVLTVGESKQFAARGGMITFILEGDRVRFEINQGSAERSGLKISAQLLKLAAAERRKD